MYHAWINVWTEETGWIDGVTRIRSESSRQIADNSSLEIFVFMIHLKNSVYVFLRIVFPIANVLHNSVTAAAGGLCLLAEENAEYREMLSGMMEQTDMGATLSTVMRDTGRFPAYLCGLVEVGERTGRTEEALSAPMPMAIACETRAALSFRATPLSPKCFPQKERRRGFAGRAGKPRGTCAGAGFFYSGGADSVVCYSFRATPLSPKCFPQKDTAFVRRDSTSENNATQTAAITRITHTTAVWPAMRRKDAIRRIWNT